MFDESSLRYDFHFVTICTVCSLLFVQIVQIYLFIVKRNYLTSEEIKQTAHTVQTVQIYLFIVKRNYLTSEETKQTVQTAHRTNRANRTDYVVQVVNR
ncbi:hypothetical protein [Myroides sp. NP-2]|uniref:hypothetical protein n=1 Tax=Myroides sp. NP-2 TaxID=2759945 RepID=UPI0015FE0864|nr:hypothetical protein [Myroides sp. NP-2]